MVDLPDKRQLMLTLRGPDEMIRTANFALLQQVNFLNRALQQLTWRFVKEFDMTGDKCLQCNIFPVKYRKVRHMQPYGAMTKPRIEFSNRL